MKVLITGANGQLGYALQKTGLLLPSAHNVQIVAVTRTQLDLSAPESIAGALEKYSPDAIINAAAYTAVDKAEVEKSLARAINADAVSEIAAWCENNKKILIQISTDFVFDGKKSSPYRVDDQTNPMGVYGVTKQQGEVFALSQSSRSYIVRTGWVYGEHGTNFVKTILRLAAEREYLGIVSDQIGTPTYAMNLSEMLWQLLLQRPQERIWHFSDAGVASWYDFAVAIANQAKALNLLSKKTEIKPIATLDYPTPAQRPAFSVLDKKQTWEALNIAPVHWQQALTKMLNALKQI